FSCPHHTLDQRRQLHRSRSQRHRHPAFPSPFLLGRNRWRWLAVSFRSSAALHAWRTFRLGPLSAFSRRLGLRTHGPALCDLRTFHATLPQRSLTEKIRPCAAGNSARRLKSSVFETSQRRRIANLQCLPANFLPHG